MIKILADSPNDARRIAAAVGGKAKIVKDAAESRSPILSAWLIVTSGTESGTHFIPARGGSPAFYTSSRVALLEAQPGQAVLLEAGSPVPHIIKVDYDAFVRARGMEPR